MFRTFEIFLVKAAENLSNKIFCLGLVRQEKAARTPSKSLQGRPKACRPGPHLKAAAKGGPAWPGRLGTLVVPESVRAVKVACVQAIALYVSGLLWDPKEVGR